MFLANFYNDRVSEGNVEFYTWNGVDNRRKANNVDWVFVLLFLVEIFTSAHDPLFDEIFRYKLGRLDE